MNLSYLFLFINLIIFTGLVSSVSGIQTSSSADNMMKTDLFRDKFGVDGWGMKVGVISDGVDSIGALVEKGYIPPDVTILRNSRGGDEGTKMLEVIHSIAPGASLYFHDSGTNPNDFTMAVRELVNSGCQIICDDVIWLNAPVFEDGSYAGNIKKIIAENNSVILVSAAGNYAKKHYQGNYCPDTQGIQDFSCGNKSKKGIYLSVPFEGKLVSVLKWADKSGHSTNNFSLFLQNPDTGERIISGTMLNDESGNPFQFMRGINMNLTTQDVEILLEGNGIGKNNTTIDLLLVTGPGIMVQGTNIVSDHSVFGHSVLPDVISVAAGNIETDGKIEDFSSRGTSTILNPFPQARKKPDITAPDGVIVHDATGNEVRFDGTSAAAPNVAGALALLWRAFPSKNSSEIRVALYNSATDYGKPGWDEIYGYGFVNILGASEKLGGIKAAYGQPGKKPISSGSSVILNITTTVPTIGPGGYIAITSSFRVSKPGKYRLSNDILTDLHASIISIESSDVTFDGAGHTIEGVIVGDAREIRQAGIMVGGERTGISDVLISNLSLRNLDFGVFITKVKRVKLKNVSISGSWAGIFTFYSEIVNINSVNASGNEYGISNVKSINLNISDSIALDNRETGIAVMENRDLSVVSNLLLHNKIGIWILKSTGITIYSNNLSNNRNIGFLGWENRDLSIVSNLLSLNDYGISISNSTGITIYLNNLRNSFDKGLSSRYDKNISVMSNVAENNSKVCFAITDGTDVHIVNNSCKGSQLIGIGLAYIAPDLSVISNVCEGNGLGIALRGADNAQVYLNEVKNGSGTGISLFNSSKLIVSNNKITGNKDIGLILSHITQSNISDNRISENNGGISLDSGSNLNKLIKNIISGQQIGVFSSQSGQNEFSGNTITGNSIGIGFQLSDESLFYDNRIVNFRNFYEDSPNPGNRWNILPYKKTNIINGTFTGGNYWGYPNNTGYSDLCTVNNETGFCTGTYQISENNTDYFPLGHSSFN